MKDRIINNWFSTIIGCLLIIFSGVLFFVDTKFELELWQVGSIAAGGILLIFAKDRLVDVLIKRLGNGKE